MNIWMQNVFQLLRHVLMNMLHCIRTQKINDILITPMTRQCRQKGAGEMYLLPIRKPALGGGWSTPLSGRFTPRKDPVLIIGEVGWTSVPVLMGQKISPPLGFDSRTVQPVASRYTDWAVPAAKKSYTKVKSKVHPITGHKGPEAE